MLRCSNLKYKSVEACEKLNMAHLALVFPPPSTQRGFTLRSVWSSEILYDVGNVLYLSYLI
jgi:hypothetical protein